MSGVNLIDPRGMTPTEWTSAYHIDLERFGAIPALQTDAGWKDWGASVTLLSLLSGVVLPNPYEFDEFEVWAQRFNEILGSRP